MSAGESMGPADAIHGSRKMIHKYLTRMSSRAAAPFGSGTEEELKKAKLNAMTVQIKKKDGRFRRTTRSDEKSFIR